MFSPGFHGNSRETEGSLLAVKSHSALMKMLQEVHTHMLIDKLLFRKKKIALTSTIMYIQWFSLKYL